VAEQHPLDYSGVFWVLENYEDLSSGRWPDPVTPESLCVKRSIEVAGWVKCCELAAEVSFWVNKCWPDYALVKEVFGMSGYVKSSYREIAKRHDLSETYVRDRIHRVIRYCCAPLEERRNGYRWWYNKHRFEQDLRVGNSSEWHKRCQKA
jgi:hypothetical protein